MIIRSLSRRTDLIFAKHTGSVIDRGFYVLVQTPNNPDYHWGNYIIFDHAPGKDSLKEWTALFDREFTYYSTPHHYVFTWETKEQKSGDYQEFLDANFTFDSAVVLTSKKLKFPAHFNDEIRVRKILSDSDWDQVIKLQVLCADPKFVDENYEQFKRRQTEGYRKMSEAQMGSWFGAFIGEQLVGDLGIFHEEGIGRYQNVETHPAFRRSGICGTLVYQTGLIAFDEFKVCTLVMEADINYHAARIYESVGFLRTEVNHALSWCK